MNAQDVARFWSKVDVRGPDECWPWLAGTLGGRYGAFWCDGRNRKSNRVAFELGGGEYTNGPNALHSCDFMLCCNPRHLHSGTHKQNMKEMAERERACRGEAHHSARLTPDKVREIRAMLASGEKQAAIAKAHGISQAAVGYINTRRNWKHVQ